MDDQTGICWSDPAWPFGALDNRSMAEFYFEQSPFFDTNSNNTEARNRGLDPTRDDVLRSLPGDKPEYVIVDEQPPNLYVIRKQLRPPNSDPKPLAYYYIMYMSIYQAPSVHATAASRLRRAMHHVLAGMRRVTEDLAPLPKLLREQQRLAAVPAHQKAAATPVAAAAALTARERARWDRTDEIILHVMSRYPAPALPPLAGAASAAPGPDGQGAAAGGGDAPRATAAARATAAQPAQPGAAAAAPTGAAAAEAAPAPPTVPAVAARRRARAEAPPPAPSPPAGEASAGSGSVSAGGRASTPAAPSTATGASMGPRGLKIRIKPFGGGARAGGSAGGGGGGGATGSDDQRGSGDAGAPDAKRARQA